MRTYNIKDCVGENCITQQDGEAVHDLIHPALVSGEGTLLDFEGCTVFASLFFNHAIGKLLGEFKPEQLNEMLSVVNLSPDAMSILTRVIDNAKRYYGDPKVRKAQDEAIQEQAEKDGAVSEEEEGG